MDKVHSVLVYNGLPMGLRIKRDSNYFDVPFEDLKKWGLVGRDILGFKKERLYPWEKLLMTREEMEGYIKVREVSLSDVELKLLVIAIKDRNSR